jgi:hypothetical protein
MNFERKREPRDDDFYNEEEEEDLAACAAGFRSMVMAVPASEEVLRSNSFPGKPKPLVPDSTSDHGTQQKLLENLITKTVEVKKKGWTLPLQLPLTGPYHPTAHVHFTIAKTDLETVLGRLQTAFYRASCSVQTEEATARCLAMEQVEFVVQIFQHPRDGALALMEVQRVSGDGLIYAAKYVPLIRDAVAGTEQLRIHDVMSAPSAVVIGKVASLTAGQRCDPDTEQKALEATVDLLRNCRYDARSLGLESLVLMTDPLKSGNELAKMLSHMILTGTDGTLGRCLFETILTVASTGCWPGEQELSPAFHAFQALTVLAHAVNLADTTDLHCLVTACPWAVDSLWEAVCLADQNPHTACLAAHILAVLCLNGTVSGKNHLPAVQRAHTVGACGHAALEQASGRLLTALQSAAA